MNFIRTMLGVLLFVFGVFMLIVMFLEEKQLPAMLIDLHQNLTVAVEELANNAEQASQMLGVDKLFKTSQP